MMRRRLHSNTDGSFLKAFTSLVCTVALAKIVTHLNGKAFLGYIKIYFDSRIIIIHTLIVRVIAIHSQ